MKTLKFKLYFNHGKRELHKTIEGHASVYNHCIALQRRYMLSIRSIFIDFN